MRIGLTISDNRWTITPCNGKTPRNTLHNTNHSTFQTNHHFHNLLLRHSKFNWSRTRITSLYIVAHSLSQQNHHFHYYNPNDFRNSNTASNNTNGNSNPTPLNTKSNPNPTSNSVNRNSKTASNNTNGNSLLKIQQIVLGCIWKFCWMFFLLLL